MNKVTVRFSVIYTDFSENVTLELDDDWTWADIDHALAVWIDNTFVPMWDIEDIDGMTYGEYEEQERKKAEQGETDGG